MNLLLIIFPAFFTLTAGFPRVLDSDVLHSRLEANLTQTLRASPEYDANYWYNKATEELNKKKEISTNQRAKNIILFMGDGMSVPTLTGARIFLAETNNKILSQSPGLSFEKFPISGFSRTYCVDNFVADSACSATAFLGGVKGNLGTIGVNGRVTRRDLKASLEPENKVSSIASWAQKNGKATGFVTNTRVTHASPAGTFAHVAERNWECDADMEEDRVNSNLYDDIAEQLILREPGKNFNVIMGGGRAKFIPKREVGPDNKSGSRLDGINLIKTWKNYRISKGQNSEYVTNVKDLEKVSNSTDYLLGLFAHDHMDNRNEHNPYQPTLEEMTATALKVLKKAGSAKGYFLFVEGGRIDMAHHTNQAQISFEETIEFSKAVEKAVSMTDPKDTLIVVTADHAHTMSINGYPTRDNSIFGFAGKGKDNLVYTTLSYANGPGYTQRKDLSRDNTGDRKYVFPAGVPLNSETHGGDDIAVFARGPNAQIFSGSYEQSYIPHAMAYSSTAFTLGMSHSKLVPKKRNEVLPHLSIKATADTVLQTLVPRQHVPFIRQRPF